MRNIGYVVLLIGVYLNVNNIDINQHILLASAFMINILLHIPSLYYLQVRMGVDTTAYINQAGQWEGDIYDYNKFNTN